MSVEFQVKIQDPVLIGECVQDSAEILAILLGTTRDSINIEVRDVSNGLGFNTVIARGAAYQSSSIVIGKCAVVDVSVYNFEDPALQDPEDPSFQDDAGTWLIAQVSLRTDLSFILSLSFAIAVALRTRSPVLDDAGHLSLGRYIEPNELIDKLRLSASSMSLEEAASLLSRTIDSRYVSKSS